MPRIRMESVHITNEDNLEYFTLYWQHGERNIIKGRDIEDAFTKAGYGAGAVPAIDWYDEGVSNTHYWNKDTKEWVQRNPITINSVTFAKMEDGVKQKFIAANLECCHEVNIEFANKHILVIQNKIGHYALIGHVCVIEIYFAEYCEGNYFSEDDVDHTNHHYMVCNGEYFSPKNTDEAIKAFIKRFTTNPAKTIGGGMSIKEIKEVQSSL